MSNTIKVLLVDDHTVVREGLRTMLGGEADIDVVGEASTGEEALQKVTELESHVVLMDIRMPGMSGTEAARRVKNLKPTTAVIIVSIYESEMYEVEAMRAGAAGYLTEDSSRILLCHSIRAVIDGGTVVRSGLLRQAVAGLHESRRGIEVESDLSLISRLTERERDVLRLLAKGYANKAIAAELDLAEVTIKKYVQNVVSKLEVSDRTHAAIVGGQLGLAE